MNFDRFLMPFAKLLRAKNIINTWAMRNVLKSLLIAIFFFTPNASLAGGSTDRLSVCLVENTNKADEINLVRWMALAYTAHPGLSDLGQFSARSTVEINIAVADLFERLLTKDCRVETKSALIIDGDQALESSFEVLGKVAGTSLMDNAEVMSAIMKFMEYVDSDVFESLLE